MSLSIFYTPDGHRRFAESEGISLTSAYKIGVEVLVREIIEPVIREHEIDILDIFCLSNRNLHIREESELTDWLSIGQKMLGEVVETCSHFANVKTVGSYFPENLNVETSLSAPTVRFFIGTSIEDKDGILPVDIFIRSGGELRLSGAPRALLGDDTELYSIPTLHPCIRYEEIHDVICSYKTRYIRNSDSRPSRR